MDRSNPHRITQTLLIHLIDYCHETCGTAQLDADIKEIFQKFVYHLRHNVNPPVMILAQYLETKESFAVINEDFDAINDFWMPIFTSYTLPHSFPSSPNNRNSNSINGTQSSRSEGVKKEQDEEAKRSQPLDSLLQTLTVRCFVGVNYLLFYILFYYL
jgi:hypothetical protein